MQRRQVLKLATLTAAAAATPSCVFASDADAIPVKRVLIVFKCHLDVGFTMTQEKVMRKYFDEYYPAAMARADEMRALGREGNPDRYIWTTGSWLLYEYLEQATPEQRKAMEAAVRRGDITWHALPFSWQTEMLDRSMIAGALGLSADLDARFGRKTIGAKMTDVPGHSRGIIAPLQAAGVRMLDIGINAASVPPDVPDAFLWKDAEGNSLAMLYHRHDYGSVIRVPGSDLAVAVEVRNDNSGPHTIEEIKAIYAKLRSQFPGAKVEASTLSDVAAAMEPYRSQLPIFSGEIGDTWIYGIPSDPMKVARYQEVARLRQQWIAQGKFAVGDATDRQLLRRLLLEVEHTWGTDTKSYLDNDHYRPADLAMVIDQAAYKTMTTSWQEKRDDLDLGLATLPVALREQVAVSLKKLEASTPAMDGLKPFDVSKKIEGKHFTVAIDPQTRAIGSLIAHASGQEWASPSAPIALLTYQTLSAPDFADYLDRYVQIKADWAPRDFGKPNIEHFGAMSQEWHPKLTQTFSGRDQNGLRILLHLRIDDEQAAATGNVAWPSNFYLELMLPDREPVVEFRVTAQGKLANRMPEAMWLTFNLPKDEALKCSFTKVNEIVDYTEVVSGGGRAMHAVKGPITLQRGSHTLTLVSHDAPVIALGTRSPLNFTRQMPSLRGGVHMCLFNNAWGTNYPQWASGDWLYRLTLRA